MAKIMSEKPMLGGCCVCLDERGWTENPLVYCDGQTCNVAVHQACYGIVTVPSGPWFCRKCESQERAAKVKCELCPHREGGLKKTDNGGWAHVVCALYIPEVTFGSVSTMEPVILAKVPSERYSKACFICEEENRSSKASTGACMSCAKVGCKSSFHVTCAQMSGLLCEESTGLNQTKYCGYCKAHLPKGKKTSHKSQKCSELYKVRGTSSSEEIISAEEDDYHSAQSFTKPGDIRYTKAGKKRSKSLEDSLETNISQNEQVGDGDSVAEKQNGKESESTSFPHQAVDSVEDDEQTNKVYANSESMETENTVTTNEELSAEDSSSKTGVINNNKGSPSSTTCEGRPPERSTPMLVQSASTDTQATDGPKDEIYLAREKPKSHIKKDTNLKTASGNNKLKGGKKQTLKRERKRSKKDKIPLSGFIPHPPILPACTDDNPPDSGNALLPRHSVTTLEGLGLDRSEACDPLDTAENNRIFKNDFTEDGVTVFQKLMNEQMKDAFKFFCEHGSDPEVSGLMDTLKKIREENNTLENTIKEMTYRKEQLMLLKSKLSTLQVQPTVNSDAGVTKQTQPPNASSSPAKSHSIVQPAIDIQTPSTASSGIFPKTATM